jgi:hypothetical protein
MKFKSLLYVLICVASDSMVAALKRFDAPNDYWGSRCKLG